MHRPSPRAPFPGIALLLLALALPATAAAGDDPLAGWSPEARALIRDLVARKAAEVAAGAPPPVVAFDCDNTLIDGDISFNSVLLQARELRYAFPDGQAGPLGPEGARQLAEARAAKAADRPRATEALLGEVYRGYHDLWESSGRTAACGYLARLLRGMTPGEAQDLGRDAFAKAEALPRCQRTLPLPGGRAPLRMEQGIRHRKPMQALVDLLRGAGWEVFVVSASAKPLVEAAAARYGVPADHVLGVRTEVVDGRLSDRVLDPVTWRQGKVDALRSRLGARRPALALGDSWTDFEMLADAERALLVDRGKTDLWEALKPRGVVLQPRFEGTGALPACAP